MLLLSLGDIVLLRMVCTCRSCGRAECCVHIDIEVEEGKSYRLPNRCVARNRVVTWNLERIEVVEL